MLTKYVAPNAAGAVGVQLDPGKIEELVGMAQGNHCQSACTRLFEYTRRPEKPFGQMEIISQPTKFFEASLTAALNHKRK